MAGQVVQRGERTWLVRVYLGLDAEGKRKYHNKNIHGTKKDAQRYLNRVLLERDTTDFSEPSKELLGAYLARWLETVARHRVAVKTFQGYKDIVSCYLKELGDRPISKLISGYFATRVPRIRGGDLNAPIPSPASPRGAHRWLWPALPAFWPKAGGGVGV